MIFALLILLIAFQVAYSNKVYGGVISEKIIDAECIRHLYTSVVVRSYLSSGMVDPDYVGNTKHLHDHLVEWWPYMNPCFKCGNPEAQFKKLIAATTIPHKVILIYIMVDQGWGSDVEKNREFLTTLTSMMQESKYLPLIVTNKYNYEKIMGEDWSDLCSLPLYYQSLNGKDNCDDFVPFCGWYQAIGKIYKNNFPACTIKFDVAVGCDVSESPFLTGEPQGTTRAD
ncbi:MAG: hypothetical protein P4L95_03550 [Rouxiella aceris]|uniref:hypothetical protein n=1 Tax=Rouxiella aceris TaxID=2703884 RepID=UPI0028489DEC|nr:hypothetical protein [Rouxiella aceris]MDR3430975.1 hypothetical protein [Rouxiella aceris]